MYQKLQGAILLAVALGFVRSGLADDPNEKPGQTRIVKLGAVAYAPDAVTIFRDLTRYLNANDLPADFVLYSNYDALVEALEQGEIDIAWNTPLAHGQYHVRSQCSSQTLVMRDVDFDVRSVLVARADSGIRALSDLQDRQLVLGSSQSAESTVLPLHFLKQSGVDLGNIKLVSLDKEVDSKGNPCASPRHVLQALRDDRGEAGIITADLWSRLQEQPSTKDLFHHVWTSPPFSHCVFTASADFDKHLAERFTRLMTAMEPADPACSEIMRLEGTKQWLPGSPDGFEDLVDALLAENP